MPVKRMSTDTTKAERPTAAGFDPSTWGGQARSLARNDADAAALLAGGILAASDILVIWAALHFGWVRARDVFSGDGLLLLAVEISAVLLIWTITYARSLRNDTTQVRQTTWRRELDLNEDLDGDGIVGFPEPIGHVVTIRRGDGQPAAAFSLPDLDPPSSLRPLRGFPADPPVTPNDVIWILSQASATGLGFRDWDKRQMPSGVRIDRELWTGILDGLLAWQFATASQTSNGRRIVGLRTDVDAETMINAVRQGAAAVG